MARADFDEQNVRFSWTVCPEAVSEVGDTGLQVAPGDGCLEKFPMAARSHIQPLMLAATPTCRLAAAGWSLTSLFVDFGYQDAAWMYHTKALQTRM
jgi:hypothetical protein